jgi:hypothetical protein
MTRVLASNKKNALEIAGFLVNTQRPINAMFLSQIGKIIVFRLHNILCMQPKIMTTNCSSTYYIIGLFFE